MTVLIADIAKEFDLIPGQIFPVLDDLGVTHDAAQFEADDDALELLRHTLPDLKGSKEVTFVPNRTPRDIAVALGVPQPEVQKTLMMKMKVMATLTTTLKPEVAEQLVEQFGYALVWADAPKPKPVTSGTKAKKPQVGAQLRPTWRRKSMAE
jgi:hypothetical protein